MNNYFNLPSENVFLNDFNAFAFQSLKKDTLDQIKNHEMYLDMRSGDLVSMFQNDADQDLCFAQLTKSKKIVETEILNLAYKYLENNIDLLKKITYNGDILELNDFDLFFERNWVNYQRPGEFIPLHRHSGVISFVIWVQIPYSLKLDPSYRTNTTSKDAVGHFDLVYASPFGEIRNFLIPVDNTYEGKILMFPAEMLHQVYPFYEKDIRITFSGNIRARKKC